MRRRLPRIRIGASEPPRREAYIEKWVSPTHSGMSMPRRSAIESLIQLTLHQAKHRHRPTKELKDIHDELKGLDREFKDFLIELANKGTDIKSIEFLFDTLVVDAYLLGSASPNPTTDRTAKANMVRQEMRKERAPALPPWKEYVINRLPTMKKNSALARARILESELKRKKIKPPAFSTLRQFVGEVDRQRA